MSDAPAANESEVQQHGLLQALQSFITIIVVALFIVTFTAQPFRIPSASMEPTLLVGDFLLVDKQLPTAQAASASIAPAGLIHRGEIVVFHYPVDPTRNLIKRVIGLPGDRVRLHDGHVFINARALDEPYAVYRASAADEYRDEFPRLDRADPSIDSRWWIEMHTLVHDGELTIPPDRYFVLGDNRNDSEDSRYWGLVPREAIVGRPFLIYLSMNVPDPDSDDTTDPQEGSDSHRQGKSLPPSLFGFARWNRTLRIPR
jgi:signal peptidase I